MDIEVFLKEQLQQVQNDFHQFVDFDMNLLMSEMKILWQTMGNDSEKLRRAIKRRLMGDPLAYIIGKLKFRGNEFLIDRRAYITDPETSYMIDAIIEYIHSQSPYDKRSFQVLEVGLGCGALAISLKKDLKDQVQIVSVEIDSAAIVLAQTNVNLHKVDIQIVESDLFRSLPETYEPDLIFGDPPWGDESMVYDSTRPSLHYQALPRSATFPLDDPVGVHRQIIQQAQKRGWKSLLFLNAGVLSTHHLQELISMLSWSKPLHPKPNLTILHGQL